MKYLVIGGKDYEKNDPFIRLLFIGMHTDDSSFYRLAVLKLIVNVFLH